MLELTSQPSPCADDNRFDMRPFLYNAKFGWQFRSIDAKAAAMPDRRRKEDDGEAQKKSA